MLELLVSDLRPFAQDALALLVCIAALVWGAGPERVIALVWLVMFEIIASGYLIAFGNYYVLTDVDPFLAGLDIGAGLAWIAVALNANRMYPMLIAALQLLAISAHLVRGLIETIAPVAYALMVVAPSWLQLIVLAIGVVRHVRRRKRYGTYREWRVPVRFGGFLPARARA